MEWILEMPLLDLWKLLYEQELHGMGLIIFLKKFKTLIISSLISHLDVLQVKNNDEANKYLDVLFPKFSKKHPLRENLLDIMDICGIFYSNHPTKIFPSLPGLKETYWGEKNSTYLFSTMTPQQPCQSQSSGMMQNFVRQFSHSYNQA